MDFAIKNNLAVDSKTKVMTMYLDNPFITDAKNLRTSIAMSVPQEFAHTDNEEIGIMTIAGKYTVGHLELKRTEYEQAWKYMYHEWLLVGNEKPRDSFPFEMYITQPPKNFRDTSCTHIYIPIE